ncbi:MAG: bacillithiol biosynthesis cysteine-adding enzyme BshC [Acidobacteriota bacterium]
MEAGCLRYTSLPGTSKLYSDFLYHFDRVRPFYHRHHLDVEARREAAREIKYPAEMRHSMVAALRKYNGDSPNLHLLAQPGTVAVVTGQQVGLFSGPSYTVHKALTAARMAAELTAQGIPAVPIFWLATEDHDFAEVNHVWSSDINHQPLRFEVPAVNGKPRPVGDIAPASYPTAALRESLAAFPYGPEVAALVEEAYQPGRTMGEAFAHLLRKLLPHAGLILMDPLQPEIRALAAPFMREAVQAAPELTQALAERNKTLAEAGYHAQVHVEDKTSLFFLLENGERQVLRREGSQYAAAAGRKFTPAELQARAAELSPNALLRPVMQDYLLPTIAYVGGPAELAYLAQSEVIYRKLLGRFPLVMPRAGFTLLDSRSAKLMERYSLHLPDFFDGPAAVRERIAGKLVPPHLNERFATTRADITAAMAALDSDLCAFDSSLESAFQRSRAKIFHQLGKIEAKTAREALRRDARAAAETAYLEGLLYPHKHLQERFYTILPFLAQHGLDLVDRLAHHICLDCPDHLIVTP